MEMMAELQDGINDIGNTAVAPCISVTGGRRDNFQQAMKLFHNICKLEYFSKKNMTRNNSTASEAQWAEKAGVKRFFF